MLVETLADVWYLSYEEVNQRLFGNDLLQLLQLLKSRLRRHRQNRVGDRVPW